jgi:hypothetical protein
VRVALFVGKVVVAPMHRDPKGGRELQGQGSQNRQRMLEPKRAGEAPVRQEPMEAQIQTENTEQQSSDCEKPDTAPAEEPREQRKHRKRMTDNKSSQRIALESHNIPRTPACSIRPPTITS